MSTSRQRFEAAMRKLGYNRSLDSWSEERQIYDTHYMQCLWEGWRAAIQHYGVGEVARTKAD